MTFAEIKSKHSNAFAELATYARDDQRDADYLNPLIHAKTVMELTRNAPNLYSYVPCSVYIDELYHDLLEKVANRHN